MVEYAQHVWQVHQSALALVHDSSNLDMRQVQFEAVLKSDVELTRVIHLSSEQCSSQIYGPLLVMISSKHIVCCTDHLLGCAVQTMYCYHICERQTAGASADQKTLGKLAWLQ